MITFMSRGTPFPAVGVSVVTMTSMRMVQSAMSVGPCAPLLVSRCVVLLASRVERLQSRSKSGLLRSVLAPPAVPVTASLLGVRVRKSKPQCVVCLCVRYLGGWYADVFRVGWWCPGSCLSADIVSVVGVALYVVASVVFVICGVSFVACGSAVVGSSVACVVVSSWMFALVSVIVMFVVVFVVVVVSFVSVSGSESESGDSVVCESGVVWVS